MQRNRCPPWLVPAVLAAALAGRVAAQSDDEVARAIRACELRSRLLERLGDEGIGLKVDIVGETASLRGEVGSSASRDLAEEVALTVPGVKGVDDALTVRHRGTAAGPAIQDAALENRVRNVLLSHIGRGAMKIDVEASGGTVSLKGAVPSREAARRAVEMARTVNGVKSVVDLLRPAS